MYLSPEQRFIIQPASLKVSPKVQTLFEQGSSGINEDVLLVEEDVFGVFDGSTSLEDSCFDTGVTGGYLAANIAAATFRHDKRDLYQAAVNANERILSAQKEKNIVINQRHLLWSTSMAVVRTGKSVMEYCQIGDAVILLLHDDGGFTIPVPDIDIDRETLMLMKAQAGDETLEFDIAAQIRKVRLQMNRIYGALNGETEASDFIRHGFMELEGVTDILLFTDGLFLPKEDPASEVDWQEFVDLYRTGGLHLVRDYVRRLQALDPARRKYPRFKCHDDIAAVAIDLQDS